MNTDKTLTNFLTKYNLNLTPQQKEAVSTVDGNTLLLAVPGSGKTTVLISRLGFLTLALGKNPDKIMSLTFSRAGVRDLKSRFNQFFGQNSVSPKINTIHSFAYSVIRTCQRKSGRESYSVLDNQNKLIREIFLKVKNDYPTETDINDFLGKVTYAKNLMLTKSKMEELFEDDFKLLRFYENYKKKNRLIDFDDMLLYSYQLLKKNPNILSMYQDQFDYIQVDEAQDNSKVQHEIIKLLNKKKNNLLMVADEDQTIYSFRGAYPKGILEFDKEFSNSRILKMETNFRAPNTLVNKANQFIKLNDNRYDKKMVSSKDKESLEPVHEFFETIEDRDNFILQSARHEGKQTAVLFRNNDSAILLVDLLSRNNIPFALKESNPSFFSNYLIQDIKNFYDFAIDETNAKAFNRIWFKFFLRLSKEEITRFKNAHKGGSVWDTLESIKLNEWNKSDLSDTKKYFTKLKYASPKEFFTILLYDLDYINYLEYIYSKGTVREDGTRKVDILRSIAKREPTMKRFFTRLDELKKIMNNPELPNRKDCLTLSTIHSAKGLEFEKVFLIDVIKEVFPSKSFNKDINKRKEELLEEIRIFYVAVTRAKKELEILSVGKEYYQPPGHEVSPFIDLYFNSKKNKEERKKIKDFSSFLLC